MRWIPAMQQWGCDACRVMYPAQPVVQPFAMAMAPNKRGKGLVIAISVAAVIGAGVAITLIARQHKKPVAAATAESGSDPSIEVVAAADAGAAVAVATKPIAPVTPATMPVPPRDTTLGKPQPMELADLWLWPRKDGSYLVTSPVFEVVFPHRPTAKVETSAKPTADGKPFDVYTLSDDLQGRGVLQLQVMSLGRGARDGGAVDAVKGLVAKVGPITETHRTDRGYDIARIEASAASTGETVRVEHRADLARGLIFVATSSFIKSDQATVDAFLDSIHLRPALDPFDDPKSLTVRVRKEHGANEAHDTTDSFRIDLPWTAKVARIPADPKLRLVNVTVTATHGKASVALAIEEASSWDALAFSPAKQKAFIESSKATLAAETRLEVKQATEKLGGLPAIRLDAKGNGHSYHLHLLWNPHQHRRYSLMCVDAPCDVVALSLKFADPIPVQ